MGKDSDAEAAAKRSIELNQRFFEGWLVLGLVYLRSHKLKESEASFRKLTEVAPNMPEAFDFLAIALSAQGKQTDAAAAKAMARTLRT